MTMLEMIVIKTGSSTNTIAGQPDHEYIDKHLCAYLPKLMDNGMYPVLVISGAIAIGMKELGLKERPVKTQDLQLCAGIGQPILMEAYRSALKAHDLNASQILLTYKDLKHGESIRSLLNHHRLSCAVPVINYNDTIDTKELRMDNNNLALRAAMDVHAKKLVFITEADGLMDGENLIKEVDNPLRYLHLCRGESAEGTGGMKSTLKTAAAAQKYGITTIIGGGRKGTESGKYSLFKVLLCDPGTIIRPLQ